MESKDYQEKIKKAYVLLAEESTSLEKFESVRSLIKGINPKIDKLLDKCSKALSDYETLQEGKVIELTIDYLPQNTEKEKQRKKRLLLLIRLWNDLKSEVERAKTELNNNKNQTQTESFSKLVLKAKGPLGIITVAAVVLVGTFAFLNSPKENKVVIEENNKETIKVIIVNDKKIPLDNLVIGVGVECDNSEHYHAKDHISAKALDGGSVTDPGGCGFGKVKETQIVEIEK